MAKRRFSIDEKIFETMVFNTPDFMKATVSQGFHLHTTKYNSSKKTVNPLVNNINCSKDIIKFEDYCPEKGYSSSSKWEKVLKANFEVVKDDPLPMFRFKWTSPEIFGDIFNHINDKIVKIEYVDFPLNKYEEVIDILENFCRKRNIVLKMEHLPDYVFESFRKKLFSTCSENEKIMKTERLMEELPKTIRNALHNFQKRSILFAFQHKGKILIGDEMGLGKTIQAIAIMAYYKEDWPAIIVTPSSLKDNWQFEVLRWLPEIIAKERVLVIKKINELDGLNFNISNYDIIIISYSLATKNVEILAKCSFNVIIIDECHMLKSKTAMRSKAIVPLAQKAKRRILLSGTAIPSRPVELYTQLQCLRPENIKKKHWFMNQNDYSKRYCDGHMERMGRKLVWNEKGHSNLLELNVMLNRQAMIRRLKKDALPELSPKIRKIYRLDKEITQNPEIATNYRKFNTKEINEVFNSLTQNSNCASMKSADLFEKPNLKFGSETKRKNFMQLYKSTGIAKVKAACALLERKIAKGRKTIIFGHHKSVLDSIETFIQSKDWGYIRIDGRVTMEKRHGLVKQFQRFDYCKIALLSISATGVGITLTAAERVIFAEIDFVPARILQCEDRAHRIGQKKEVVIYYILARKTLDDFVWPLIHRKLETISSTLDGVKSASLDISSSTKLKRSHAIKEKNVCKKVKAKQTKIQLN